MRIRFSLAGALVALTLICSGLGVYRAMTLRKRPYIIVDLVRDTGSIYIDDRKLGTSSVSLSRDELLEVLGGPDEVEDLPEVPDVQQAPFGAVIQNVRKKDGTCPLIWIRIPSAENIVRTPYGIAANVNTAIEWLENGRVRRVESLYSPDREFIAQASVISEDADTMRIHLEIHAHNMARLERGGTIHLLIRGRRGDAHIPLLAKVPSVVSRLEQPVTIKVDLPTLHPGDYWVTGQLDEMPETSSVNHRSASTLDGKRPFLPFHFHVPASSQEPSPSTPK